MQPAESPSTAHATSSAESHADANRATAVIPEVQQEFASRGPAPAKILLLEDDPVQLAMLSQHVDALGYEVLPASSIAEAKRQLEKHRVELAILDVQLPDGSGFDLCEQLDSSERYSGLPIIVLSSITEASVVRKTRASGARFFLGKPYDPNVLLAIIERALDERV